MSKRVKVWRYIDSDFPEEGYLGEGELLGHVPLSDVYNEEELKERFLKYTIASLNLPKREEKGLKDTIDAMFEELDHTKRTTPKIRLDTGEIVYGCQIWWEPTGERDVKDT